MAASIHTTALHKALAQHFSLDELKLLCVNAGINPESVPFAERGIDLFTFCMAEAFRQQDNLSSLLQVCATARPDIPWSDFTVATTVPAEWTDLFIAKNLINTQGGLIILGDVNAEKIVGRDEITNVYGYTYEQAVELIQSIRQADQLKAWDGRTPYVGLAAFQEQDAALFFGRERLIDLLTEQLRASSSLAVFGPSGSGKSSVVRAGLLVALKRGALEGSDNWLYATFSPGDHPIEHLADALSAMALKAGFAPSLSDDLRTHGQTDANALSRLGQLLTQDTPGKQLVVFVDQFEESFTLTRSAEQCQAFFDLLTTAVNQPDGRTKVIVSARSDFLSQCAAYPELRRMINAQFRLIGAMVPDELARAIALPALAVGASVQPALVSAMINETQGDPGMLPLMQFALKDLFDAQPHKVGQPIELTLDVYTTRGGMRQILERRADATFNTLSPAQQVLAQRIFSGLIEVGRGTVDTRRTARIEELVPAGASQAEALGVIQVLSNERLLTTTADKDEPTDQVKGTVTIVHERLIDAWPWLRKLVDECRQAIARQNEIADDAQEWEVHGHDVSFLYGGARLQVILEEIKESQLVLGELASAFLEASQIEHMQRERAAQQQQQEKLAAAQKLTEAERKRADDQVASSRQLRQRAVYLAVALVLALAAVVGAVWFANESRINSSIAQENAFRADNNAATAQADRTFAQAKAEEAKQQAQIALARQLSAQASADALRNPVRAALLGIEAYRTVPQLDMLAGLLTTLQANWRLPSAVLEHEGWVNSVAFSPDGKTLASGSDDKTIRLWDVSDPHQPKPLGEPLRGHEDVVLSVAFSRDGKMLASGSGDQAIRLWEVDPEQWIDRVCRITGRNFTKAEWRFYIPNTDYRMTCSQWPKGN